MKVVKILEGILKVGWLRKKALFEMDTSEGIF